MEKRWLSSSSIFVSFFTYPLESNEADSQEQETHIEEFLFDEGGSSDETHDEND